MIGFFKVQRGNRSWNGDNSNHDHHLNECESVIFMYCFTIVQFELYNFRAIRPLHDEKSRQNRSKPFPCI